MNVCKSHGSPAVAEMLGVHCCPQCIAVMDEWAEGVREAARQNVSGVFYCRTLGCGELATKGLCSPCRVRIQVGRDWGAALREQERRLEADQARMERESWLARPCQECKEPFQREPGKGARLRCDACQELNDKYGARASKYGLTIPQLLMVIASGRCRICKTTDPQSKTGFHVDHCHETGVVRGLLCQTHNLALGFFRDSVKDLYATIDYLTKDHFAEPWNMADSPQCPGSRPVALLHA